jgi:transmembrane sensor
MVKDLFIKYLQGKCSYKEFEQFLVWLKQESLSIASKELIKEVWDKFEPEVKAEERVKYNHILDKIHHKINIKQYNTQLIKNRVPVRSRFLSILTRAAAILLFPVLSLLIYKTLSDKSQYFENLNEIEVQAPFGSRTSFTLGDGTKVWLNHGSKLRYPYRFDATSRKVFLTGEAYFAVAQNKKVPFIVETNCLDIKATGTAFNVSAYLGDDYIETTLVEGEVVVYERKNNRKIETLSPNECLRFNSQKNKYSIKSDNIEKYTAWKDNLLVFKNDPVEDVAKKLSRWFNVEVEITNEKAKEFTITATFCDETLPQVLELITLPTPVSYQLTSRIKLPDNSYTKGKVTIGLKK